MVHPNSVCEINELRGLISEGNRLKELPESISVFGVSDCSGLAVPIVSRMDSWMAEGIKQIYSLLPKTIIDADFAEVASIHHACDGQNRIITFVRKERINTILNALHRCLNFVEWLIQFNETGLGHKQKAVFYFGPLEAMVLYIHKELVSPLVGLEDGRTRKTALLHLYGRIFQLAHGIIKLNDVVCCHLLIASLRGLLEIYVDMLLLNKGLIDNDLEKFYSFYEIYLFNSAKTLMGIDAEIKTPPKESSALTERMKNEGHIKDNADMIWHNKPNRIRHWTGESLKDRSRKAGELKIFRDIYYYGNMFVHSGYVDFPKTEDDAHLLCAHVYSLSLEILKKSTDIICAEINITRKENIEQETTGISLLFGHFQVWKSWMQTQKV
jgi:hypothetical protein